MDFDLIDPMLDWLRAHPHGAGLGVMAIAFLESLALVGLFLPGAVLMFGIGALIGAGNLELWPTLAWAAVGAIGGDGVSFWLGRRFRQQIRTMWPLRRYPELLAQSTQFFYRHGGKSILFGRFVGPIRPVIPLVAGMLDMPIGRFTVVNIISGVLWAPAYVLPGMVFAVSLGLAAEVATRLAMLFGFLVLLVPLLLWLTRRLFLWFHRHAYHWLHTILDWGQLHPRLGRLPAALLDPEHPEARGLTLLAVLLLLAGIGFLLVLQGFSGTLLPDLDQMAAAALKAMRSPWADRWLLAFAAPGEAALLVPLFLAVLGWLGWRRHWQAVGYWLAAALFALLFSQLLALALHLAPAGMGSAVDRPGHTIHAVVLYGFLAALLGRETGETRRWLVYASGGLAVSVITFAHVYLGGQRLSAALAALTLGLLWVALLAIAYLRHGGGRPAARPLAFVATLALLLSSLWYGGQRYEADLARTTQVAPLYSIATAQWWSEAWQTLPSERADVRGLGSHPLTLQYAGSLSALQDALGRLGWQVPVRPDALNWMHWLTTAPALERLPVLPQVHDGHHEALLLVKPDGEGRLLALRLWHSGIELQPQGQPLWLGNVSRLVAARVAGGITVPRTDDEFDLPLRALRADLLQLGWSLQVRQFPPKDMLQLQEPHVLTDSRTLKHRPR